LQKYVTIIVLHIFATDCYYKQICWFWCRFWRW